MLLCEPLDGAESSAVLPLPYDRANVLEQDE
jgi:hypothetical protein